MRRFLLRLLGYGSLLAVLLVLTAAIVIETDWFKEHVRRFAVQWSAKYLVGQLSIGRLGGSLLRGVTLENLSLAQGSAQVFSAGRVTIRYDPLVLVRRRAAFADIKIEQAVIRVAEDASGWNVAHLLRPTSRTGAPVDFAIGRIALVNSEVIVDPVRQPERRIADVNFDGRLIRKGGELAVTVTALSATDERTGYRLTHLTGSFADALNKLDATFKAETGDARVAGRVTGDRNDAGRMLHVDTDLTKFNLEALFGPAWTTNVTGHAVADVRMPVAPGRSSATFVFNGSHASAFGYEGTDVQADGTWTTNRVDFKARARGYGAFATIDATWQPRRFTGAGTFRELDMRRLPRQVPMPDFATRLAGKYGVTQRGDVWTADVTLDASLFEDAQITAGTIGHLEVADGMVKYGGRGDLAGFNVRRLAKPLELPTLAADRFESRLTGSFEAEGVESTPEARTLVARASLTDARLADATFDGLQVATELSGRRLNVAARGGFTHVTTTVAGLPEQYALDATGTADVSVTFEDYSAPIDTTNLDVDGWVHLAPSTFQDIAIREGKAVGNFTDGVLNLTEFTVGGDEADVSGSGTLAFTAGAESAFTLKASTENLARIGERFGRSLSGAATVDMKVSGPSDHIVATGTVNARELAYSTTASALTVTSNFTAEVPEQRWDALTIQSDTTGAFAKIGNLELVRFASKLAYTHRQLDIEARLEDQTRQVEVAGILDLEPVNPDAREVTIRQFALTSGGALWTLPNGQEARVALEGDRVHVEGMQLVRGTQVISVDGGLSLGLSEADEPATLTLGVKDVLIADVNQMLLGTRKLEGVVNGTISVSGTAKAPVVDASVAIAGGAVEGVRFDGVRAKVEYADHRATIDATLDQTADNHLTVTGTVPIGTPEGMQPEPMALRVQSSPIGLGLIQAFTQELSNVAGTGTFDLTVSGTPETPRLNGTAAFDNGAFDVVSTGVRYQGLSARLRFDDERLTIESFALADPHGVQLSVTGGLNVLGKTAGTSLDVRVSAEDLQVLDNKAGTATLDADLEIRGAVGAPEIAGFLKIDQARIEVDRLLETTTTNVYATSPQVAEIVREEDLLPVAPAEPVEGTEPTTIEPIVPSPGLFDRAVLDLQVNVPDNLVLRGRDLRVGGASMGLGDTNIVTGGTLSIRKPAGGALSVLGALEIVRGFYSFQGRRFEVERDSTVRFRGTELADPAIDITANREISGVTTTVRVQGSASRPQLTLSSQPPLDSADILSLIVFGQPANDLGTAQRVSLAERAGTMAAGAFTSPLADSVARALNLDMFEIIAPTGTQKNPVVSLGSQIGSRLYVGVQQEIGHEEGSALSIEYRVAEFMRLVTSVAQGTLHARTLGRTETGGVDLMFQFRY